MDILYLLIPLSVVLVFLIGAAFWWALRTGQFDDLDSPAHRIPLDEGPPDSGQETKKVGESPLGSHRSD